MLWMSPTRGEPVSLRYAPAEARMFVFVRPRALLQLTEGQRAVRALGPAFATAVETMEQATGHLLSEWERVTLAYAPSESGVPRLTCVLESSPGVSPVQVVPDTAQPVAEGRQISPSGPGCFPAERCPLPVGLGIAGGCRFGDRGGGGRSTRST